MYRLIVPSKLEYLEIEERHFKYLASRIVKEAIRKHPEVKRVNCYIHCSRDILVRDILVDYYVYSDVDMCDEFLGSYESKKLNTYIRRNKLEAVTFDLEIIQDDIEFAAAVLKGVEDYA